MDTIENYYELTETRYNMTEVVLLTKDYSSIEACIKIANPSLIKEENITTKFAAVGKILKEGYLYTADNQIATFGSYIVRYPDGKISVMESDEFNSKFKIMSNENNIEHIYWITRLELGGSTYIEFIINKNIFIITNSNNDKFIVYTNNDNTFNVFNIVKVSIPIIIGILKGYTPISSVYINPEYKTSYVLRYKNNSSKIRQETNIINDNSSLDIDALLTIDTTKLIVDNYINKLERDWYNEYSKVIEKSCI